MIPLSSSGEIGDFQDVDQFQPGRSEFECGFFAVAIVKAMNQIGRPPTQSTAAMIAEAEQWYAQDNGSDSAANEAGMTLPQLYALLSQVGLHYQAITPDIAAIRAWVTIGYPVIIAGAETAMFDLGLHDIVPYPWRPSGNHMIVITGVARDGNVLVRDPANCTSLVDPRSLRPGPRLYDAGKLKLVSATAVVPPWLPRPPAGFDPTRSGGQIPRGWSDNGVDLAAPNGIIVVRGFRDYILSHSWDPDNWPLVEEQAAEPLEISNPALGAGTRQVFRKTVLEWTLERGVFEAWVGCVLLASEQALKARSSPDLQRILTTFITLTQPFADANSAAQAALKEKA